MTIFQQRLIIALDEWLGIGLLVYLWKTEDPVFWWVFGAFVVMIYAISYPLLWIREYSATAEHLHEKTLQGRRHHR